MDARARVAGLVGLGMRARAVVVGVEQVRAGAKRRRVTLVLVATDAAAHSREKLLPLLAATRVPVLEALDAEALGAAVGKGLVAAVGITDPALAAGIRKAWDGPPGDRPGAR